MGSVVVAPWLYSESSVVLEHGLSCSIACGIFLDQGSNLHWLADSLPLSHQGSPCEGFFDHPGRFCAYPHPPVTAGYCHCLGNPSVSLTASLREETVCFSGSHSFCTCNALPPPSSLSQQPSMTLGMCEDQYLLNERMTCRSGMI